MSDEAKPVVAVLGGINGAGKTTASRDILLNVLHIPAFVNADAIARGLNAFNPEAEAFRAGRVMLDQLHELVARRESFAFETTLAARTYAGWLNSLRATGYQVQLFYYWLNSPEAAISRVAERVRAGGHHIPEETIRRRYGLSVRNFLELYRPITDHWRVYDNSHNLSQLIAFGIGAKQHIWTVTPGSILNGVRRMDDLTQDQIADMLALNDELANAHARAAREARLEHARMGRPVCEVRDNQVVWLTPEQVFAEYGLDENGKPPKA